MVGRRANNHNVKWNLPGIRIHEDSKNLRMKNESVFLTTSRSCVIVNLNKLAFFATDMQHTKPRFVENKLGELVVAVSLESFPDTLGRLAD